MFSLSQVIDAPPTDVVRAFTEPEPFAAWFVADGFTTPADRVVIDGRSGGTIAAVFVSEDGQAELPFTLRFGELKLPHRVELLLDGPAEVVTVQLEDLDGDRTRLHYRSSGLPAEQEATIQSGVAKMLGLMATYFRSAD